MAGILACAHNSVNRLTPNLLRATVNYIAHSSMSRFSRLALVQNITSSWVAILRTYWVPVTASVATTCFGILLFSNPGQGDTWVMTAFLTSILATCIFGGVALLDQDRTQTPLRSLGRYTLGAIPLVYFVILAQYHDGFIAGTGITFALLIASSVFFLLCSAELRRASTAITMWQFGLRSISISLIATAVGVIGYIAASLAAVSIEHLFQIAMSERVYATLAVCMFALITPTIVIASISHVRTVSRDASTRFSPLLLRLVQVVFVPILGTYFIILYAYLAKIVTQWELPQESVVLPILIYSIVGVCTYALVDPWRRADSHPIFKKLQLGILYSFFPLLILYGFALVDRIRAYGMTEARYLSALFAVWLFVLSLASIRRRDLSLRLIPITLSLLFLFAALPGVGAISTTVRSQQQRLIALLQEEKILVDSKINQTGTRNISRDTDARMRDILYMLNDRNGIAPLASAIGLPESTTTDTILDSLQFNTGWGPSTPAIVDAYTADTSITQVTGYDELIDVTSWPSPSFAASTTIRFSGDGMTLSVSHDNMKTLQIPLSTFPTAEHPTTDAENEDMRVRLIPTQVFAQRNTDGSIAAYRTLRLRVLIAYQTKR